MMTTSYKQALILLFLYLSSTISTLDDDKAFMEALLVAITPKPSGWTSGTDFCTWSGIKCNSNHRVSIIDLAIDLATRSLSGTLPASLNSLSQLSQLSLQNNYFEGALPSLSNLSLLRELDISNNNFSSIPTGSFAGLPSLQKIDLSDNECLDDWYFLSELATDSSGLVTLEAISSNLVGPIPDIFDSFPRLQNLDLSFNDGINGTLPKTFNNSSIQNLRIDNTGLVGSIEVLSGMTQLRQVWLSSNRLTGQIPNLSACTDLADIDLEGNHFNGVVPLSLVSLPKLRSISLAFNYLQGPMPEFPKKVIRPDQVYENSQFCKNTSGNCDPQVTSLLKIAEAIGYPLSLAMSWKGNDACNNWTNLKCDSRRNVIAIHFDRVGYSGNISPAFVNLTSLRELYFNDNNLTGTIPSSLTHLPELKILDVSKNHLTGRMPVFRPGVTILSFGNHIEFDPVPRHSVPQTNGSWESGSKNVPKSTGKILEVVLIPTLIVVSCSLVVLYKWRKYYSETQQDIEQWASSEIPPDFPVKFPYEVLVNATNNFNEEKKLGAGGFGSVFDGSLCDRTRVAVKRLDCLGQGLKEFLAEVWTIGCIHHVNLVRLVGFYAEKTHRLLVYEHMINGSLDKWIFSRDRRGALNWNFKKKIILQIAKGLAYLHEECKKKILHLDIKPQNVLLDDEFNAKLSDFGLAKMMDRDQSCTMTQMRGTRGYLAPEWLSRKVTEKADVYSYGVVVTEIIFERKNLDYSKPEESTLIQRVKQKVEESASHDLLGNCSEEMQENSDEIEKILNVGVCCLHTEPGRRPSMSMVVKVLEGSMALQAVTDYSAMALDVNGNPANQEITQLTASELSGPR